jgi:putative transposase
MGTRAWITDAQWSRVEIVLAAQRRRGRPGKDDRRFFEAVVWWRRTGVPWRDLPEEFGPWQTVFNRFDRWSKAGRWTALFAALATDIDDEWQSMDATLNRAHQHAAGGKGGPPFKGSAGLAVGPPRKSILSSTRSGFRSPSRLRRATATTS